MVEASRSKLHHNDAGRWHNEKVLFELLGANDNITPVTFVLELALSCKGIQQG
jgi:hypothetical protein